MNFYPFHIGDYMVHTLHLSPVEDIAYRRLLDLYYSKEGDIPRDTPAIARLLRMREYEGEVESVLREFFVEDADRWSHGRCDEEIAKYKEAEPEREAKKENERERQRRSRERRKELFAILRANGEVPVFDTPMHTLQEMVNRVTSQTVTRDITLNTDKATGNQNQNQNQEPKKEREPRATRLANPFVLEKDWAIWAKNERPDLDPLKTAEKFADHWHAKPGKDGLKLDWFATWRNWVKAERSPPARLADVARVTVPIDPRNLYVAPPAMTPEERAASDKRRLEEMARFKTARTA